MLCVYMYMYLDVHVLYTVYTCTCTCIQCTFMDTVHDIVVSAENLQTSVNSWQESVAKAEKITQQVRGHLHVCTLYIVSPLTLAYG